MNKIVLLNQTDNVATSLATLSPNARVEISLAGETHTLTVRDEIPFGHKIAVRALAAGTKVLKYGEVIGLASRDIEVGEWVHVHNVESARGRGDLE